ncbi:hypothetical protein CGCS363_v000220 [Colletotrichum siamense]|uniref:uncharacterized protein n=1 Tax=Colletotrichum siamense TaxID=690259 RepID=UPI001873299B|nr:uncharacterized protein CGCS363_v000220 [Colletotrichum siamense]KAF5516746.1 hypothetical protein CGCS363_v000220 [Colletotrichum siamense]
MSSSSISELYRDVPKADLRTIKFESLFDKDHDSLEALIKACETDGFFYQDLQATGSEKFWKDLKEIDESTEVKLKTPTVSLAHGFKALGNQSGSVEGHHDGFEALKIGRHKLTGR